MAGKSSKEEATKETVLEMTPMIDVTFLLLVFFLCTIKFKTLEGKIEAFLPKDVGVNATPVDKQLEKIEIHVWREKTIDTNPHTGNKWWVWNENQLKITIGGQRVSLKQLHESVKAAAKANPDAKATIYPEPGTLYIDAVKVVNECLRAKFTQITFAGAPMDS